ncbi:MerR family DNA-binding protein [Mesorhizobium sp.]|uniref:MerR family DNA-binding protein n=1 Tax=Mesorhizobium sp. TaxID=1871066 RepID=UPI0025D35562|nr:MerR family DNA-binding protein [Mesorhizobium sp.]
MLPRANRTGSGPRSYDQDDLGRLTFIKQCRDLGFGINQVRVLLDLSISPDRDCAETRDIAQKHLDDVRQKLAELTALEPRLENFVTRCNVACASGPGQDCVIFKELAEPAAVCCLSPR